MTKSSSRSCFQFANFRCLLTLFVVGIFVSQLYFLWYRRVASAAAAGVSSPPTLRGIVIPESARRKVAATPPGASPLEPVAAVKSREDSWDSVKPLQGSVDTGVQPAAPEAKGEARAAAVVAITNSASSEADWDPFVLGRARSDEQVSALFKMDPLSRMGDWIAAGGRFPILVVTCDRFDQLQATLTRLLAVRGVVESQILVIQDACPGDGARQVPGVVEKFGLAYHRNPREDPVPVGADGAMRIATAYGYALRHALEKVFPRAPGVIVVEDDMAFSPDFYEYFHAVAPLIDSDESIWLASAWHDNGFDYLVADANALRRTRYFPGLGWLLPRRLWETELSRKWPHTHWDHWMRDASQHRGRDVVVPEIPRDYHMGVKGTFMDMSTHNDLFGSIALHNDSAFSWDTALGAAAVQSALVSRLEERIATVLGSASTQHFNTVERLTEFKEGEGILWYAAPPESDHVSMRPLAKYIGIWHEAARGSRDGVHELWWQGSAKLWLINAIGADASKQTPPITGAAVSAPEWIIRLKPADIEPIHAQEFHGAEHPVLPRHALLFGARFDSPLAHLDGGHDRNGAPDLVGNDAPPAAAKAAPLKREKGAAFMSLLHLPEREPPSSHAAEVSASRTSLGPGARAVAAREPGLSCSQVCEAEGLSCALELFAVINSCEALQDKFPCKGCGDSAGKDQPAYIALSAPSAKMPGLCLVNGGDFDCSGKWTHATRLCPCRARA